MTSKRPYPNQDQDHQQQEQQQQQQQQQDHQNDEDNDTPKRRLGKVDRGREACNECRRHKIRCHPHPDDPQHLFPCSRCERMNLSCEFAKHNRGRKRKRPLPLLAGTTVSEDQPNSIPAQSSSSITLPNSNPKSKLPKQVDNHPHSFGDPRFPFISNEPDTHSHSRSSHHARIEDDFRPSKGIMSLRHMVGEESSEDVSSDEGDDGVDQAADNSARLGDPTGKKSSNKGKTPTRGPELVDDPIRAGFVDEVEARALFHLFMTHHNGPLPMLDPAVHTHDVVREQSPFLYTAILCVTSRYLSSLSPNTTDGPNMSPESAQSVHQQILVLARDHMTWTFAEAITSIDVIRAMVILTINKEPDDDKAGFHMNRAILAGRELDLGRIPSVNEMSRMNEEDHRRVRMKQRVWLCLFIANSIFNMQFQQPMLISQSDPLVATAHHWLKRARPDTVLRDTQLVCSVELRRKFLKYRDLLVGCIPNEPTYASALSLSMLTRTMNQDWDISCEAWIRDIIDVGGTSNNINKPRVWTAALRLNLNLLIVNQTLRLLPQDQIDVGLPSSIPAFNHCLNAATTVLLRMETLDKTQLTFASDTFLHFALYAATLLSTLCRGQHPYKFEAPEIEHCRRLITKVADALDAASAYPSDSPTLHAWYLRRLCQLLPPPTTTPIPSGPPLSVSSSDAPLPPLTNAPTYNPIIDPLLQNVTTTMPVDPALTTVIGNELDFFLGDFPWVGLGLDATIGTNNNQLGQNQNQGNTWDNGTTSNNNDLIGMFGNAHAHTLANGYGGANQMGLTHNNRPGPAHGGNLNTYPNTHHPMPLEMPYDSGGGMGGHTGMGMGMGAGGMAFSHVV
ncbi:hypothetical protein L486_05300 [Kwoniella mangroviensis CBS 10435]|uniref:Zn(2)-C6 fungal-type domain-containing protein n=1 Tax=Kwoniella mangroviensis CBS 10435 TaxID=1331196 RepID=A0A1B9IQK3_9TREE|nr:uncharacterized protein I203_08480 [Kwoniella mangroviensis CBS 8507]OCF57835.1 hypothetical protein L486_05300 [Kwoniella mangroviensis CBS 10435]OCF62444.1 hypothetical protein I203_08480 [Kwoniella mangroviensis CBS 8507]